MRKKAKPERPAPEPADELRTLTKPAGVWDDFFDSPGVDLGERAQPAHQEREAPFTVPTDAEYAAITRRTAQRMARQLLAVSAHYDRRGGRVMIVLTNGAVVGFPLSVLPGLENATAADLRKVDGGGYGLHVARLDGDISVPQLLADQLGSTVLSRAVARANARANGRTGGRPTAHKAA